MTKLMLSLAALLLLSNCSLLEKSAPGSGPQAPVVLLGQEIVLCLHGTLQIDGQVAAPYSLAVRLDSDINPGTLIIHRLVATFKDSRPTRLISEDAPLRLEALELGNSRARHWVIDHFFTHTLRYPPESKGESLSVVIDASIITADGSGSAREEFERVWELGKDEE